MTNGSLHGKEQTHKVFVYGTLKKGYSNHSLLEGSEYLGKAKVYGGLYLLGCIPFVSLKEKGIVCGEVYKINNHTLSLLDALEGFPGFYHRSLIKTTRKNTVWIYHIEDKDLKVNRGGVEWY